MKKALLGFLFTIIISIVLSTIYFSSPADEKSENECPYLKHKSEITCPYLNEKYDHKDSKCPYFNGELKSPSIENELKSQQCPYLQKKRNSENHYKTIKNISS